VPDPIDRDSLLESLMDTNLYSIGASLHDRHPDVVDEVVAQAEDIELQGLEEWARRQDLPLEAAVQTLLAGLAVRYYRAVAG
jgi:hypothetical protein